MGGIDGTVIGTSLSSGSVLILIMGCFGFNHESHESVSEGSCISEMSTFSCFTTGGAVCILGDDCILDVLSIGGSCGTIFARFDIGSSSEIVCVFNFRLERRTGETSSVTTFSTTSLMGEFKRMTVVSDDLDALEFKEFCSSIEIGKLFWGTEIISANLKRLYS